MRSRQTFASLGVIAAGVATVSVLDLLHRLTVWEGKLAGTSAVAVAIGIGFLIVQGMFRVLEAVCDLSTRAPWGTRRPPRRLS